MCCRPAACDRENSERIAVHIRHADVIGDHRAIVGDRQRADFHRSGNLRTGGPGCSAVHRSGESDVKLTRACRAICGRIVVVDDRQMRVRAGSRRIDADAGDEMIDRARRRINGDARNRSPCLAISGGAHHDVVFFAACTEAAIRPDHIDVSRAIDSCGRQIRVAQSCSDEVAAESTQSAGSCPSSRRHWLKRTRQCRRFERGQRRFHSAEPAVRRRGHRRDPRKVARPPGLAAVARNAHQNIAGSESLVPLRIAVAVERACRRVVADGPVLVVKMRLVDDDGIAPVQAVGRAADRDVSDQA